jgi:hypothetical protein
VFLTVGHRGRPSRRRPAQRRSRGGGDWAIVRVRVPMVITAVIEGGGGRGRRRPTSTARVHQHHRVGEDRGNQR